MHVENEVPEGIEPIKIKTPIPDNYIHQCRNGHKTEFSPPRKKGKDTGEPLVIQGPLGWKAEKRNGVWFWVCDCPDCLGNKETWAYLKCDAHNVCVECGIHRRDLTETPWGHRNGFMCQPCSKAIKAAALEAQMDKFKEADYRDYDFEYNDEIKCPHCGKEHEPDVDDYGCGDGDEGEYECHVCDKTFKTVMHISVTWSTSKIEE